MTYTLAEAELDLALVLHEEGIGCNSRRVSYDGGAEILSPLPPVERPYVLNGWAHDGDHGKVATAMLNAALAWFDARESVRGNR